MSRDQTYKRHVSAASCLRKIQSIDLGWSKETTPEPGAMRSTLRCEVAKCQQYVYLVDACEKNGRKARLALKPEQIAIGTGVCR